MRQYASHAVCVRISAQRRPFTMIPRKGRQIKRTRIKIKQTIATLLCEERFIGLAYQEILKLRNIIENYIVDHPDFARSLFPVENDEQAPEIIQMMIRASGRVGAGPMSTVAGAISEYTAKALIQAGAGHVIMDNGGDIALKIDHPVVVGIYTGNARINNIGIRLTPKKETIGVCTSSGTIGHSLSFGCADAATVIAGDVLLADALATVLGNQIRERDQSEIETILSSLMRDDIEGMIVIIDDMMGVCGKIPSIVKANVPFNKISLG
jgi:ApbE superfamily uncharacterized protein (UPF0280 family)